MLFTLIFFVDSQKNSFCSTSTLIVIACVGMCDNLLLPTSYVITKVVHVWRSLQWKLKLSLFLCVCVCTYDLWIDVHFVLELLGHWSDQFIFKLIWQSLSMIYYTEYNIGLDRTIFQSKLMSYCKKTLFLINFLWENDFFFTISCCFIFVYLFTIIPSVGQWTLVDTVSLDKLSLVQGEKQWS